MPKTSNKSSSIETHTGHKLTIKEDKFIAKYVETGNGQKSVIEAGYNNKNPRTYAQTLLNKDYIKSEIDFRMEQLRNHSIATAEEVMTYFTQVMKGEIQDQFGLEASLGERTKAAQELAKRLIDIPNKLQNNEVPEVKITLDWGQRELAENPTVKMALGVEEIKEISSPTPYNDSLDQDN